MIDRSQLRKLHGGDFPLHILEQAYLQALFLQELYRETDNLVFKGGTFLRHVHGLDRYSEDLDFTAVSKGDVIDDLREATGGLDRYGVAAELDQVYEGPASTQARLRYVGPLHDGTDRSRGSIDLEISTRGDIFREPEWQRLFVPYPETRAVTALCLRIEEAFAEKLRALATRSRGRDLYDCWFLTQQNISIDTRLFTQKMDVIGGPSEITISISEREWDRDLSVLLEHAPEYERVLNTVTNALSEVGIDVTVSPDSQ